MKRRRRAGRTLDWLAEWSGYLAAFMVVLLMTGALTWVVWPEEPERVDYGTVVGFRFSGSYPHRCRMWIKPGGATLRDRVLLDPNTEQECTDARIGDRWERWR